MRTVFFDVDTQLDFLAPAGALAAPGASAVAGALAALTRFAARQGITIVSTVDTHTENDPEFETWKPHCVSGTQGHQKFSQTLLKDPAEVRTTLLSPDQISGLLATPQLLLQKHTLDPFSNPNLRPLLKTLAADRYVVYGLVTEICVRLSALGLLETGARVEVVTDAVCALGAAQGKSALEEVQSRGGVLTTVAQVIT